MVVYINILFKRGEVFVLFIYINAGGFGFLKQIRVKLGLFYPVLFKLDGLFKDPLSLVFR